MLKAKFIAIEGVNYSGKSYLARYLSEYSGIPIYRGITRIEDRIFPNLSDEDHKQLLASRVYDDLILSNIYRIIGFSVISDRTFLSCLVYNDFWLNPEELFKIWLDNMISHSDFFLVYCNAPSLDAYRERFLARQNKYLDPNYMNGWNRLCELDAKYKKWLNKISSEHLAIFDGKNIDALERRLFDD